MAKKIISGMNSPAFPSGIGIGISKRYWTAVMIAQGMSSTKHHKQYIKDICHDHDLNEDQAVAKISFGVADALLEQEDKP